MLPKPKYTGGAPPARNCSSSGGSARIGDLPGPALGNLQAGHRVGRPQHRIGGDPGAVCEHVVAHVLDGRQPNHTPLLVDRRCELLERLAVRLPEPQVFLRRQGLGMAAEHVRRGVAGRGQHRRAYDREDVGDVPQIGDRARRELQRGHANDQAAAARRLTDHLELQAHRFIRHLLQLFFGRQDRLARHGAAGQLLEIRPDRHAFQPVRFDPFLKIGRCDQARGMPQCAQRQRQRHQRLDISPRANRGKQYLHTTSL
jgi:hypothetical protein